jgi:putative transposase
MIEIITLLSPLTPLLTPTVQRQLARIIEAMLCMTGRVTMLGISRWTGEGGSYRTIQRFFTSDINWRKIHWSFVRDNLLQQDNGVLLIGGDEVVVTKSGKNTFGLGRFFSSLYDKPVSGLCFLTLSIISVDSRKSYPIFSGQIIKKEEDKAENKKKSGKKSKSGKRGRGRPKGSRNKNRRDPELSAFMLFLREALAGAMALVGTDISVTYFVYDGALGNNAGMQAVRQCGLHIISKLRYDSALYFPYTGPYSGRGRRKKYGKKLIYSNIPAQYLKSSVIEDGIRTNIYQVQVWHKLFADMLNVVIIIKICLKTGKSARVVLYSSDLELSRDKLKDYYSLRFQIEFNFRDAKQFWGLEDFMNTGRKAVCNAANLAMFMVNFSCALLRGAEFSGMSVTDLKAFFRARKYVQEAFKFLPEEPEPVLIDRAINEISRLGRVNLPKPDD